jgi:predicted DNA-binding transcriptional regulator AlpA
MVQKAVGRLPLSLAPRGLSRVQAAEYIGVGVTKFDEMVDNGRMPRPKRIDGRLVWDRLKLDEALDGRLRVVIGLLHLFEGVAVPSLEAAIASGVIGIGETSATPHVRVLGLFPTKHSGSVASPPLKLPRRALGE